MSILLALLAWCGGVTVTLATLDALRGRWSGALLFALLSAPLAAATLYMILDSTEAAP